MSDNLERFIRENKAAFDDKQPSDRAWRKIDSALTPTRKSFGWVWKAAAILFFLTSLGLYFEDNLKPSQNLQAQKEKIAGDFSDVESYYFQIIAEKRDLIYKYDTLENPIEVNFEQDLQKLDAMYQVLKEELKVNPSKKVVDALILNMLVRIDVLNAKIEELENTAEQSEEANANNEEASV